MSGPAWASLCAALKQLFGCICKRMPNKSTRFSKLPAEFCYLTNKSSQTKSKYSSADRTGKKKRSNLAKTIKILENHESNQQSGRNFIEHDQISTKSTH